MLRIAVAVLCTPKLRILLFLDPWLWNAVTQNRPAELLAKFFDAELRASNKGQSEERLEATLDRALILFRYISVRCDAP
jgi:Cullin family